MVSCFTVYGLMHVFFSDSFFVCVYVSKFRVTRRYVVIHTLSNIKPVLCWKKTVSNNCIIGIASACL